MDIFGANSALFHAYEEIKKINKHADGQSRRIDASIQSEVAANMQRKNGAFDFVDSPRQQPGAPGQRGVLGDAQSHSPLGGKHFRSSGAQNNRQLAPLVDPALPLHQAMDARNHEMRNIHFAADHLVQAYKYAALESNISTETIMRTNEELMKIAKSVQRTSLCFQEVLGGLSSVPRCVLTCVLLAHVLTSPRSCEILLSGHERKQQTVVVACFFLLWNSVQVCVCDCSCFDTAIRLRCECCPKSRKLT